MHSFAYSTVDDIDEAVSAATPGSAFLAGGTTLIDLMKLEVLTPCTVVDINALPLHEITVDDHGITAGALARMSDLAEHPTIRDDHRMIAEALRAGASQQLRNMASIGGNLLQRTRCAYYREVSSRCNRRTPGSGCAARDNASRMDAVLGTSSDCIATHPSDLAVALVAADAEVFLAGLDGRRSIRVADLYRLPGNTPHHEHTLRPRELITSVGIPVPPSGARSTYVKIRDRSSYEFALASAAVRLVVEDGTIRDARIAVGGVATVPWRLANVESALVGRTAEPADLSSAVALAADGSQHTERNAFKVPLLRQTILRAVTSVVSES